jgi:hypothetical protein
VIKNRAGIVKVLKSKSFDGVLFDHDFDKVCSDICGKKDGFYWAVYWVLFNIMNIHDAIESIDFDRTADAVLKVIWRYRHTC